MTLMLTTDGRNRGARPNLAAAVLEPPNDFEFRFVKVGEPQGTAVRTNALDNEVGGVVHMNNCSDVAYLRRTGVLALNIMVSFRSQQSNYSYDIELIHRPPRVLGSRDP